MIIRAELKCKQTGCEADTCAVDKVIELPSPRFRLFSRALLADYDFIAENKNAIRHDEDARHCLLILDAEGMDGFLVDPQGHNYARYSAFVPNARSLLTPDMAIDRSVGGMKQYLFNMTTSNRYNQLRFKLSRMLFKLGILNEERRKALIRFGNSLKSMAAQQQNIFEGMNIRYFGPIDGHDVKNLARILRDIKDLQGPKILHLHTIKGKGFAPAEMHATEWHAPGKFDPVTGERFIANTEGMPPLFQDVFGNTLVELAEANPLVYVHGGYYNLGEKIGKFGWSVEKKKS